MTCPSPEVLPPVGAFGGTFDPFHRGHLRLACAFRDELGLAEVRVIPTGASPHRPTAHASPAQRFDMVTLALADEPCLIPDNREVTRGRVCYTVETLESLRATWGPTRPLWWLVGADAFAGLMTWHRWEDLLTLAHFAVALRPGFTVEALPAPLQTLWHTRQAADFPNQSAAGRIRPLLLPPADISATAIRAALSQDHAVDDLVDARVLDYLRTARLYQTESRKIAP